MKFAVRNGIEDLPERIDVSLISEVATGTCAPYPQAYIRNATLDQSEALSYGPSSPSAASSLSFSLLTASGASIADQIAPDLTMWADWVDGLNMLRRDGGHVASTETEKYVKALTEIGLKIRLLSASRLGLPTLRRVWFDADQCHRPQWRYGRYTEWDHRGASTSKQ